MLEFFRKLSESLFFKIFFAAIVISFVNWGIGVGGDRRAQDTPVISAGKIDVSLQSLYNNLNREGKRLEAALGGYRLSVENLVRMGLLDEVIKKVTTETVLAAEADELDIYASDDVIKETVYTNPIYFGGGTSFNRAIFEDAIRKSGFQNEQEYINYLRKDMVHAQLTDLVKPKITVPNIMAERIYKYRNEKRIADVVRINVDNLKIKEKPTAEDLQKIYDDNIDSYQYPSYRTISMVSLDTEEIKKSMEVTDEEIAAKYEEVKNDFAEEERQVSQMQFIPSDEGKARAHIAANQLKEVIEKDAKTDMNEKFLGLAKSFASQEEEATNLGWIAPEDLPDELSSAVFDAKKGDIIGPIESSIGWHVIRVSGIRGGEESNTLEARKEELKESILAEKVFDEIQSLSNQLQDELGAGMALEKAAEAISVKVTTIKGIDIDGKDKSGKKVEDKQITPDFLETVFSLQKDETSNLIENETGYSVVRVDEIKEPETKPFDVVKDEIVKVWTQQKQEEFADKQSKEIVEKLEKSQSVKKYLDKVSKNKKKKDDKPVQTAISQREGVEVVRTGNLGGFSKQDAEELFNLEIGEVTILPDEKGFNIIKLNKVVEADPAADEEGLKKVTEDLEKDMAEDIYYQYVASIGNKHKVIVRKDIIDSALRKTNQ